MSERETLPSPPSEPSPYTRAAPMPYTTATPERRRIWATKGTRGGGFYIVAWGPVVYGIYRIVTGALLLKKSRA